MTSIHHLGFPTYFENMQVSWIRNYDLVLKIGSVGMCVFQLVMIL